MILRIRIKISVAKKWEGKTVTPFPCGKADDAGVDNPVKLKCEGYFIVELSNE